MSEPPPAMAPEPPPVVEVKPTATADDARRERRRARDAARRAERAEAARKAETIGERLFWSYANLAAAEVAVQRGGRDAACWIVRAKLFKGLRTGTMKIGTLFADVRDMPNDRCVYCGATPPPKLHADHLIPRHRGGPESGDNLVWACPPCNLAKSKRDLLEWYASKEAFPPFKLIRRYLKLAIAEATSRGIMDTRLADKPPVTFSLDHVPIAYPGPDSGNDVPGT